MSTPPDTDFNNDGKPHEEFSKPTVSDREIAQNNFGAGYYQRDEVYQQTERFKRSLNANASVGKAVERRALGETAQALADNGFTAKGEEGDIKAEVPPFDDVATDAVDETASNDYITFYSAATDRFDARRRQKLEYGLLVFEDLPDYLREHALLELSTIDERFDPPEMRITKFFHEATRSKGGRLMDNVFGRVKKLISAGNSGAQTQAKSGFFGRSGGDNR